MCYLEVKENKELMTQVWPITKYINYVREFVFNKVKPEQLSILDVKFFADQMNEDKAHCRNVRAFPIHY